MFLLTGSAKTIEDVVLPEMIDRDSLVTINVLLKDLLTDDHLTLHELLNPVLNSDYSSTVYDVNRRLVLALAAGQVVVVPCNLYEHLGRAHAILMLETVSDDDYKFIEFNDSVIQTFAPSPSVRIDIPTSACYTCRDCAHFNTRIHVCERTSRPISISSTICELFKSERKWEPFVSRADFID